MRRWPAAGPRPRSGRGAPRPPTAAMLAAMLSARRRTVGQAVAEDVLRRIEAGEFAVGERLPTLQELMGEHGVG